MYERPIPMKTEVTVFPIKHVRGFVVICFLCVWFVFVLICFVGFCFVVICFSVISFCSDLFCCDLFCCDLFFCDLFLLWFVLLWFVLMWFVVLWFVMLWFILLWFVLLWFFVVICFVGICFAVIYFVAICFAVICFVVMCFVVICFGMICFVVIWFVIICFVGIHFVGISVVVICFVVIMIRFLTDSWKSFQHNWPFTNVGFSMSASTSWRARSLVSGDFKRHDAHVTLLLWNVWKASFPRKKAPHNDKSLSLASADNNFHDRWLIINIYVKQNDSEGVNKGVHFTPVQARSKKKHLFIRVMHRKKNY